MSLTPVRLASVIALACGLILCSCSARRPIRPLEYRLTAAGKGDLLTPPNLRRHEKVQALGPCEIRGSQLNLRGRGKRLELTVQPVGDQSGVQEFSKKLLDREQNGCLAPGEATRLTSRLTELVAMPSTTAYHLRYMQDEYVNLQPPLRLKAVFPLRRPSAGADSADFDSQAITQTSTGLTIDLKASPNLLGYEIVRYELRSQGSGVKAIKLPVEEHLIDPATSRADRATPSYFKFPDQPLYYRMLFLTRASSADHDAAILGAGTPWQLDRQIALFRRQPETYCSTVPAGVFCALVPKGVATSVEMEVVANGAAVQIPLAGSIRNVLQVVGVKPDEGLLARLQVFRPFGGNLIPVTFDPKERKILDMVLIGGEVLKW